MAKLEIELKPARVRLHSQLPKTELWGYRGEVPGPTVVVRRGQRVRVRWVNNLPGIIPLAAVRVPTTDPAAIPDPDLPQNSPGLSGGTPDPLVSALESWTVVHLHGGRTGPESDGWTENAILFGQWTWSQYLSDQRGTLLWYHDHAMHITRFNVYAGLAGLWIIPG
jgi:FtsP/CotA-like multicopper oxidase with cupredoxin domain